jgi:hypothetical protein
MESTNFEFIRSRWPQLAKFATSAEREMHSNPLGAVLLLRTFCEAILKSHFNVKGKWALGKLLSDHGSALPRKLKDRLDSLPSDGNKGAHYEVDNPSLDLGTDDAKRHLRTAFEVAVWTVTELDGERPDVEFTDPPRHGREHDELLKGFGRRPQPLTGWRKEAMCGPFATTADDAYVGRVAIIRDIRSLLAAGQQRILIEGQPGRGKTRLLKELFNRGILAKHGEVFSWFFESTAGDQFGWLHHFYASILKRFELEEKEDAINQAKTDQLRNRLCDRLKEICQDDETRRIVLVIDAIDEAGEDELAVLDFLLNSLPRLPSQITVVATVRPGHLSRHVPEVKPSINLEDLDRLIEHRGDGLEYVNDRLADLKLPEDLRKEIARVGDGNFLALFHICESIPEFPGHKDIRSYLVSLGPDFLIGIYQNWWQRVKRRATADELDMLVRMAALIAAAQAPISVGIMEEILTHRYWDDDTFRLYLTEYLTFSNRSEREVETDQTVTADRHDDGNVVEVFRFYHPTFVAFIRKKFSKEIKNAQKSLAGFCSAWKSDCEEWYARDYALRFAVSHNIRAKSWSAVVDLLTDLEFIQARFESGQGYELLTDYDGALQSHPDSQKHLERRFGASRRWVQQLVEYSRACTGIRKRHAAGALEDPVAEISTRLSLPDPPDTREVERLMRSADYASHSETPEPGESAAFDRLSEYRAFVNRYFHFIEAFPHLTFSIARKHGTTAVATAAKKDGGAIDLLQREQAWQPPAYNSLVVHEIVEPKIPYDGCGFHGGMTRDAALVFGSMAEDETWLWDTESARRSQASLGHAISCTVDGKYAVHGWPRIELVALPDGKVISELSGYTPLVYWLDDVTQTLLTAQMTPDASVVAFVDRDHPDDTDARFVVWNPFDGDECVYSFCLEELSPQRVILAPSGTTAVVLCLNSENEELRLVFDLVTRALVAELAHGKLREVLDEERVEELILAQALQTPLSSIDGRISVRQDPCDAWRHPESERLNRVELLVENKLVRDVCLGRPIHRILALSADGRLALAESSSFLALVDLAEGAWTNLPTGDPDPAKDGDSHSNDNTNEAGQPSTDEEATIVEMGFTACAWAKGEDESLMEFHPGFDEPEGLFDLQSPEFYSGFRRSSDGQVGCTFPWLCESLTTLDGTYWALHEVDAPRNIWGRLTRYFRGLEFDDTARDVLIPTEDDRPKHRGILDVTTGHFSPWYDSAEAIAWTRDGRLLITFSEDAGLQFRDCTATVLSSFLPASESRYERVSPPGRPHSSTFIPIGPVIQLSPDGRRVAWTKSYEAPCVVGLNATSQGMTLFPDVVWNESRAVSFSLDGCYIVSTFCEDEGPAGEPKFLWDVETGECLDLIADECAVEITTSQMTPWVTGLRVFRPEMTPTTGNLAEPLYQDGRIPGRFDDDITFRCRWCGHWSPLPNYVQGVIRSIHKKVRLSEEDSPVLKLPDDAWDTEPDLAFACPQCCRPLKSTPFVVDRLRAL